MLTRIVALLRAHRLAFASEDELQRAIGAVLTAAGIAFEREACIGPGQRIDFLLDGGLGIEVKIGGTRSALLRQLDAYAPCDRCASLLVITTCARHADLPAQIGAVPVRVHVLLTSCL